MSGEQPDDYPDSAAVLWARRCERCGWLDQSTEWESEEEAATRGADAWRCERCGGERFGVVSTVGG
jgi:hypothetical protein